MLFRFFHSVRLLYPDAKLHEAKYDIKESCAAFHLTGRSTLESVQLIEHYANQLGCYNLIEHNRFKLKRSNDGECTVAQNKESGWKGLGVVPSRGQKELFRFDESLDFASKSIMVRARRFQELPVPSSAKFSHHHKSVGERLRLFTGSVRMRGSTFWYPSGLRLMARIKDFVRDNVLSKGYREVMTPIMLPYGLWVRSGHVANYKKHMFSVRCNPSRHGYIIKPMNCIGHICFYNNRARSFRDLPLRLAEFGICHRLEASGALSGILRTQSFIQDDAHIICSKDQVADEIMFLHKTIANAYNVFGLYDIKIKLAYPLCFNTSRPVRLLKALLERSGMPFEEMKGEGAFYGAKLEYHVADCNRNFWQCGTIQLDEMLPQRMGLCYINRNSRKSRPIIIHRAIFGSIDRFIGVMLEREASIPTWASPILVILLFVSKQHNYLALPSILFKKKGLYSEEDFDDHSISYRVNKHSKKKVPYILVIGRTELQTATLSVRVRRSWGSRMFTLESFLYLLWLKITCFGQQEEL